MKLGEILKYNSALFLTGLFAIFVSATTAGLLLLENSPGSPFFVWSTSAMLLGGTLGLFAVKDYRGASKFVPDYFIMVLPVTALVVIFSAIYPQMGHLHAWHAMIWGFSVGICFGLLQASNPDQRRTGFPTFALGSFAGAALSMAVLSGQLHICDVYAAASCLIAVVPLFCFPDKLKSRRAAVITVVLILTICAVSVHEALRFRQYEAEIASFRKTVLRTEIKQSEQSTEITPLLPILLQHGNSSLRILISEPNQPSIAPQLRQLPFVADVIRTNTDIIHRYNEPFSWHSELRRLLTDNLSNRWLSGDKSSSSINLLIIIPHRPVTNRETRLYTSEFYAITADFLGRNGLLAATVSSPLEAANISKTMRQSFAHTAVFPGRHVNEIFVAAAQFPICTDYNELDRRALSRFEHLGFCRGMLPLFLPPVRQYGISNKVEKQIKRSRVNSDLKPCYFARSLAQRIYNPDALFLLFPFSAYMLLRFLLSRRITRRVVFSSLENGIYCGGFIAAAWIIFQSVEGKLFLYLGWLTSIFILGAACAYGFKQRRPLSRLAVFVLSALLPLTFLAYEHILFQEFYLAIISCHMFLVGIFVGSAAALFASKLPEGIYPSSYLYWMIAGIPVGGVGIWLLLSLPDWGLWCTIGVLALLRVPLIFRRVT